MLSTTIPAYGKSAGSGTPLYSCEATRMRADSANVWAQKQGKCRSDVAMVVDNRRREIEIDYIISRYRAVGTRDRFNDIVPGTKALCASLADVSSQDRKGYAAAAAAGTDAAFTQQLIARTQQLAVISFPPEPAAPPAPEPLGPRGDPTPENPNRN